MSCLATIFTGLDLGGNRLGKRGFFDIEQYGLRVVYANLSVQKKPDVKSAAECLPFGRGYSMLLSVRNSLNTVPSPPVVLK